MSASLWKGSLAGCIGGLVATGAMTAAYLAVTKAAGPAMPAPPQGEDATVVTAQGIVRWLTGSDLQASQRRTAGLIVHYTFGAGMAAAYGGVVERSPRLAVGAGVPFGCAVWLGAHGIAAPALGLAKPSSRSSTLAESAEFVCHVIYGAVCEAVRGKVRKWLK